MGRPEVFANSFVPPMNYPETYVVVFEDEVPKYKDELLKNGYKHVKVIGIERDIIGKSAKLNWVLDNLYTSFDDFVAFFDDDIKCMRWRMSRKLEVIDAEAIPAILEESYYLAKAFGARIVTFAYNSGVRGINRRSPIALKEPVLGGAYMQLSPEIRYDTSFKMAEDVDITLMELFKTGIICKDNRYGIDCIIKMNQGSGGMAEFRSDEKLKDTKRRLYQKYGLYADKYIKRAI